MPRSRVKILEEFRACAQQLGKTPGQRVFKKMTGIKPGDVTYHWPTYSALVQEAGLPTNYMSKPIPEDELLEAYARICLHLKKIPTSNELRIAIRELGSFSKDTYLRPYGSVAALRRRFLNLTKCFLETRSSLNN